MAIKQFKPVSAGSRHKQLLTNEQITKSTPEKALLAKKTKKGGRNNQGYITTRHHGGGHKQKYRIIDFKRNIENIAGIVKGIEYDPNRNALIALVVYENGVKTYIIAPKSLQVGQRIYSGKDVELTVGNCLPLSNIPDGFSVHNIELQPGKGGQMCRAAGTSAQVLGRDGKYVKLRLASGEQRNVLATCKATIGVVGNEEQNLVSLGKAGRSRWLGIRPTVRGSAMNPNDHPHGGGEGKCPVGRDAPRTPWGKRALGVKTRNPKKQSSRLIDKKANSK